VIVPCYRCGARQTDPSRGESPWRRGVSGEQLVLVCPACQGSTDWTAALDHCERCASAHLIRRLGQTECLDCGLVRDPSAASGPGAAGLDPGAAGLDPGLAEEVSRALDRLLGRR
jgi:hypothetical protein